MVLQDMELLRISSYTHFLSMCKSDGSVTKSSTGQKAQQDKKTRHSNNKRGTDKTGVLYVMVLQGVKLLRLSAYTAKTGVLLMHFWCRGRLIGY